MCRLPKLRDVQSNSKTWQSQFNRMATNSRRHAQRERERDDWMRFNRCAPRCRRKYGLDSAVVGENLGPKNQVGVRVGLANSARGRPGLGTS